MCTQLILIIGIDQNICQGQTGNQLYFDPGQSIEQRVNDLLSKMTLEEKIGQLNMPALFTKDLGESIEEKMEGCKEFTRGTCEERVLQLKFQMGLFEDPFVNPEKAEIACHTPEAQALAFQAAKEGIVILINGLPLSIRWTSENVPAILEAWIPGEMETVKFKLILEDLAFINTFMKPVVEPGEFDLMIGSSSKDIRLRGTFIKR